MKRTALFFTALLLATGALAQTPGEISFWESVRNSKDPEELRAYLKAFPNGMFAPIARARLAALEKPAAVPPAPRPAAPPAAAPQPPAAVASTAPSSVTAATRMPQAGDTWIYSVSYPRLRGQWQTIARPATYSLYVVKVAAARGDTITDQISLDGGTPSDVIHTGNLALAAHGLPLFSPYLIATKDLPASGSLGAVESLDAACSGQYGCRATARVAGRETITVPAGKFLATKVIVEQNWWPDRPSGHYNQVSQLNGGRTVTVWYVPELKRAVKFASRITVGDVPPVESNFDLDLVSYQVK